MDMRTSLEAILPSGSAFQLHETVPGSSNIHVLYGSNLTKPSRRQEMWVESLPDGSLRPNSSAETLLGPNNASNPAHMNPEEMQFLFFFAYGIIGPLIIAIGLVGNALTLKTFLGKTPVWSNGATYTYLKWLAITDTGALVMAIPMEVRLSMPQRKLAYWEAFYQAHLELPVLNSFMGSSIFIVVCLTCTRFMALFQPTTYRSSVRGGNKNTRAQVAVSLAILMAMVLSAPLVMLKQVVCSDGVFCKPKENTDVTELTTWKASVIISEGIVRVLPVILLTILNVAMIFKFRSVAKRRRAISTRSNSRADSARAEERRKLILLSTIVICFVCFNSPSAVLSMIYSESWENQRGFEIFRAISNDCELANFAINFYAYFLCSKDFRKAFFAALPPILGERLSRSRRSSKKRPKKSKAFFGNIFTALGIPSNRDANECNEAESTSDLSRGSSPPSLRTEVGRNAVVVNARIFQQQGNRSSPGSPSGRNVEKIAIMPIRKFASDSYFLDQTDAVADE